MQTSMVFNQVRWPGAGDVDDCWAVSSIQCVNVTAPWLRLVSVPAFRKAAGNPDKPGPTGGSLADTVKGVTTIFPVYAGRLHVLRGASWTRFVEVAKEHRPLSVAIVAGKLPARLQHGFTGYHRVSVVVKGKGTWLLADPLAPVYSRWATVTPAELRSAIMGYGNAKSGTNGAWAVAFPTDDVMAATYHAQDDDTPFDQADVDRITAALQAERDNLAGRVDAAIDVLDGDAP